RQRQVNAAQGAGWTAVAQAWLCAPGWSKPGKNLPGAASPARGLFAAVTAGIRALARTRIRAGGGAGLGAVSRCRPCAPGSNHGAAQTPGHRTSIHALSGSVIGRPEAVGWPGPGADSPSTTAIAGRALVGTGLELSIPCHGFAATRNTRAWLDHTDCVA